MSIRLSDLFEPRDCSVYLGREFLGRYMRTSPKRFVAYGRDDQPLGTFKKLKDACAAITAAHREGRRVG